jgi:hypothetical protein
VCIRKVPGSNCDRKNIYPDERLYGFPQSFEANDVLALRHNISPPFLHYALKFMQCDTSVIVFDGRYAYQLM